MGWMGGMDGWDGSMDEMDGCDGWDRWMGWMDGGMDLWMMSLIDILEPYRVMLAWFGDLCL